jgi:DNA-binding MarR family transcriptional regulator
MSPVAAARPLLDEDYHRLLAFRSELRGFLRWSEQTAHDAGLTPSLHQLLLVLRGHPTEPGPTIGQAAEELHIRHHSAVELAQRAESAGLICRERDPLDHRRMHLEITDHGREQLEALTREHLTRIQTLAQTLERVLRPSHHPA